MTIGELIKKLVEENVSLDKEIGIQLDGGENWVSISEVDFKGYGFHKMLILVAEYDITLKKAEA